MMKIANNMTPQKWAFQLTHILNAYSSDQERFPVNVKDIAKDFSHHKYPEDPITMIKGANLPKFDGGLFKAPSGKKGWGIIYNNAMESQGRINYTLAHEFGHYLLHRLEYPQGIQCGEQDMVRWDSAYAQIEHQANVFASNLLMPLDDYRKQIPDTIKVDLDMIGSCADRYAVSLIAATLRWIEYTERRAVIVVSRDGFILWARSSKAAYRSGVYFKTSNQSPITVPQHSLASGTTTRDNQRKGVSIPSGVWFEESCEEMVVFSELYDFTISVIQLEVL
ncbi:ImmA/IrrE family metallo-endopeptidase [Amphritea sp.]|uniref:ImmA/IrrE family metallo-endopeptidase n=1 Tax=Amphritea sp. TaxID=1872502 RepID=UPI003D0C5C2D